MCGFVGFANLKENIADKKNIISKMSLTLKKRGPNEDGLYINNNIALGHKRLIVIDPKGGKQPMIERHSDGDFIIVYNGQLYNTSELKETLSENGYYFNSYSDTEVILKAYLHYGTDVVNHLNGIFAFAIWDEKKKELFLARDHFGVKPLFYTINNNTIIFGSEIKALLEYPQIEPILDSQGISEMFGLGPAHTAGITIFKNIFEIKPAHFGIFNETGLHLKKYWELVSKEHKDSLGVTCDKIKFLLHDSITKQLVSDVPLCTFLSGGLDSSIITKFASDYFQEKKLPPLHTYSIDYVDNDKNFVKSDFQPNSDNYYINLIKTKLNTIHHNIIIDTPELASALEDAMIARDMPGMADIDSSLLLFCKNVKMERTVALTGECADEIFAGYPWFFRDDALNSNTFPWSIAINERQELLNTSIRSKINLKEYIDLRYNESLSNVSILDSDTKDTAEKRKISYLTLNWFMQTLLDRSDRMGMYEGFELRVPFCDYRIAEYLWNIPWEFKALKGREKGLLRYICKDFLPSEIVDRKKSPYPKTHNPTYLKVVKNMLSNIIKSNSSPINYLLDKDFILKIIETDGSAFSRPWFGQLMTRSTINGLLNSGKSMA